MIKNNIESLFTENLPHDSAQKHVNGKARYTDDILEPNNIFYAAIGWSKKSNAIIDKINLDDVIKSEGVIDIVTYKDIPGRNDVGPVFDGDPIFPKNKVEYFGQPIFAVLATTNELARKAVLKAKISYIEKKPIITIQEAHKIKSYIFKPKQIHRGSPNIALRDAKNYLRGNFSTGSQEHFYLEGQICMTIPQEDNDLIVYSSTQHPSETQQIISKMLKIKNSSIAVKVRRIGGGFGGKETQSFIFAAICTLLANKTKLPVKLKIDRDDDIIITGKRHDFFSEYEVGFNNNGQIKGLKINLYSRCGISADLSAAINDRALFHIDNAYYIPNILVNNYYCKTNTASNTAFRGFGGPQGMMVIENIIDNIARYLKKDPTTIRKNNFYKKNTNNITHYNMKIEDNIINEIFEELITSSRYINRNKQIRDFNDKNNLIKKGIAITPVKFGISFTKNYLNQAGSLVHIYNDGSVYLNHGGIEMGQGTLTKIAQIASNELGISINKIKISETNTSKVPNTSASAASSTTDLNGAAVLNAIEKIKNNINHYVRSKYKISIDKVKYRNNKVIYRNKIFNFNDLIMESYLNRVSLSSTGFYKTPKINFDDKNFEGRPFYYFAYGAAVSEVIIDTLTGENKLTQVDILHDAGNPINENIEIGQIEGGFIQGMGWLTFEEVKWSEKGNILTHSPSTYKIPASNDTPTKFNVKLFKGNNIEKVINRSKTTGEPPLMLSMSVFFAIKDAIASVGDYKIIPKINAPATPEEILSSINIIKKNL
ncbi:MAG: putative xanthine dehydrogenase subunit D [Alphaproteobacteria bacterium MarineAlpha5_Bin9]|nr:MAG: putative xanthine dehydrogenase subunit D [Alphaproteobacteria bacterium MarineAlpha5_Bin9]|tara:strand:+ start:1593 stop:3899 length:2307 start_codon:yes stop_codon:yes gene_type:complete